MKKLLVTLVALLVSASSFAQGTLIFNNRTQAGDRPITYADGPNAGMGAGSLPGAVAQLVLVVGGVDTPLSPTTPFRTGNAAAFFTEITSFAVQGVQPGESASFKVRAWQGGSTWETALYRGESAVFTAGPLGGNPPGGGLPVTAPTPDALQSFTLTLVPEPSTMALGVLGAAALLFRRRK
jgi:hypothetical protein